MQTPFFDDFHVHLRQGAMMKLVTPLLSQGGCRLAYVMVKSCLVMLSSLSNTNSQSKPNLTPPITTTDQALEYKSALQALSPSTTFLMTLYLTSSLTPEEIRKAHKAGITGVKSYPKGVTTNSDGGIESYLVYYPVFEAMQDVGMVLNLHGEIPSDPESVCLSCAISFVNLYLSLSLLPSNTDLVGRLRLECRGKVSQTPNSTTQGLS